MNKWIETYMEEKNLKPNELFKLDSQTFKDEYYFDEYGTLYRKRGNGYENPSMEIWGRLMNGFAIEKVKQKGRYIPKEGEYYWYVSMYGDVLRDLYVSEISECLFNRTLVFRTKEEAEDYRWFLEQVDKYKKEFVYGERNHCIEFYHDLKELIFGYYTSIRSQGTTYFGDKENIEEFRNVVGEERIKKFMFNIWGV